ncbi:MRPL23 [Cordylochernes scorpioides]|uniref:Large ribosomal subunit protein uL23m n=1 Tax=Cordylochernes scorpioides TaxID=51811 RepID=A0ABY6LU10_9ARAC|nr:MRPL23 [Cordylochernes scorpioides]
MKILRPIQFYGSVTHLKGDVPCLIHEYHPCFKTPLQMTTTDVRNYLEKICNVSVIKVISKVHSGELYRSELQGSLLKKDDYKMVYVTLGDIQTIKKELQQGSSKRLLSDRAPAFTSEKFRKFLLSCGIQPLLTTSNNPQANGLIERVNATITGKLRLQDELDDEENLNEAKKEYKKKLEGNQYRHGVPSFFGF